MDRLATGGGVDSGQGDDMPVTGHYFSEEPASPERRTSFRVTGEWGDLHVETGTGVFSSHGLDKGTGVFLESLRRHPPQPPPAGSLVVDLGCGSGVLALVMARLWPECRVLAVDVNTRALEMCADNARRNSITNVEVRTAEGADPGPVARLWSNPPVRIGKSALHALLGEWIGRLDHDGEARLVVGRNLGSDSLADWMRTRGWHVDRLSSARGFRVLGVLPGGSTPGDPSAQ